MSVVAPAHVAGDRVSRIPFNFFESEVMVGAVLPQVLDVLLQSVLEAVRIFLYAHGLVVDELLKIAPASVFGEVFFVVVIG